MKFSEGAWRWAEGVKPSLMRRVVSYRIDSDSLYLSGVERPGNQGQDRFEGTVLELRITSPMSDVIRVQVNHHRPAERGVTKFDLGYQLRSPNVRITEEPESILFTSGRLALRVNKKGW